MRRPWLAVIALAACGGGGGDDVDSGQTGAGLEFPSAIAVPYVVAGEGASSAMVTVRNPGDSEVHPVWSIGGDGFTVDGPAVLAAGAETTLTVTWAGADARTIAGATLTADSEAGARTAEVWAVAGDPALGDATFEPVTGAGGVVIGESAVVHMPTAPYPEPGGAWTDDRVHLFVPEGYRDRGAQDIALHFHGHSTTIDATVPGHRYREHVYASGANVVLAVPQGPVNAASGDFGKLMDPVGTAAFLEEVLVILYRAGIVTRPVLGQVALTSHSGGYLATARNVELAAQVDLFDSLYGDVSTYQAFAEGGGRLRSNYTASGGTDVNNQALAAALGAADAPTQANLRDAGAVVYFTAATHNGSTRDDGAYGEQLRWGWPHTRHGPRVELRSVTETADMATATWFAPPDEDLTGLRIETSRFGVDWHTTAEVAATASSATFPLDSGGAWVRVVPVVEGLADADALPSDVYRVAPGADVLVVDGFDRVIDGSWGGLTHDFAARVGEAAGGVDTVSNEAVTEDGFDMSPYRAVIWLLGDESSDDHAFSADERAAIDAYLAGGGAIVISGSEAAYDAASAWLTAATGATFASDDAGATSAHGAGALASIPAFAFGDAGAPYLEDYPDVLGAGAGAETLLAYSTGTPAAVGVAGKGALVAFPLEVIDAPADLDSVVTALLAFVAP